MKRPYKAFLETAAKRRAKIKLLRARGYPVPAIAAKMRISRARVYQIIGPQR